MSGLVGRWSASTQAGVAVERVEGGFRRIDALINIAGFTVFNPLREAMHVERRRVLGVSLAGRASEHKPARQ